MCSWRFDYRDVDVGIFGEAHERSALRAGANGLHCQPVGKYGVVADLVDLCGRELFARRKLAGLVAQIGEAHKFVGSEKVIHAIGQMLRDIRRVIGKSLGGVA